MSNAPKITRLYRDPRSGALYRMLPKKEVRVVAAERPATPAPSVQAAQPTSETTTSKVAPIHYRDVDSRYEYFYTRATAEQPGRLRIRATDERMKEFRASRVGRAVDLLVDIHAQGGAWYEVTTKDFSLEAERIGKVFIDGLVQWVKAWNQYHIGEVVVDTGMFSRAEPAADRHVRVVRDGDRIVTKHPEASPEALAALARRFGRK